MFSTSQSHNTTSNRGFTLIEVMVSVSIFALITTIGIGSLMSINNAYKQSRSQRTAIDGLNFVLDSMSRQIRTGSSYSCDPATPLVECYTSTGSSTFYFVDQEGREVIYRLNSGRIERTIIDAGTSVTESLTTTDIVTIQNLVFRMRGATTSQTAGGTHNPYQPFVVITIQGEAQYLGRTTPIALQTSITQRLLDIPTGL